MIASLYRDKRLKHCVCFFFVVNASTRPLGLLLFSTWVQLNKLEKEQNDVN